LTEKERANIKDKLEKAEHILITSHSNPDGDAIGSSLGLFHFLRNHLNARLSLMVPNHYPAFLKWMPSNDKIMVYEDDKDYAESCISDADVIFSLDYNSLERVEEMGKMIDQSKAIKIQIDHHPGPGKGFDYIINTDQTSSTAELVYDFIKMIANPWRPAYETAVCLYTGIITDTGSLSYLCNFSNTYLVIAELIQAGVDGEKVHRQVYNTFTESRIRLLGFCLSERMKVLKQYHTAYIYLSAKDVERFDYQVGDTEGIVNYPLSMKGISFSALIRELDDKVRISFRSKGDFPVNKFAREHFIGGGHRNAAGADSNASLDETLKRFESYLPQYKQHLERIKD